MEQSQVVSPVLQAVRRRWRRDGVLGGTRVSSELTTVVDMQGRRVAWAALLDELLAAPAVALPVHPAVETFETARCGVGARAQRHLPADAFLGVYQGVVCTRGEGLLLPGPCGQGARCCRGPSAAELLAFEERTARIHSYVVEVGQVSFAPGANEGVVASAIDGSGAFVGNALGRINDGRADPFSERDGGGEEGLLLRAADRPANCAFVQIAHRGWFHLGVVTRAAVAPGDELLVDYDNDFWDQQRLFRRDVARLSGIVAREEADGGRRKRRPLRPAEAATAAKDALFVWALWVCTLPIWTLCA